MIVIPVRMHAQRKMTLLSIVIILHTSLLSELIQADLELSLLFVITTNKLTVCIDKAFGSCKSLVHFDN